MYLAALPPPNINGRRAPNSDAADRIDVSIAGNPKRLQKDRLHSSQHVARRGGISVTLSRRVAIKAGVRLISITPGYHRDQCALAQHIEVDTIRIKLVEVGDWTTQKARSHAKALLGQIAKGADPRPKNANAKDAQQGVACPTLRQAWERYRDAHLLRKGRSEGTTENYRDHVERLMSDWLDQPLSVLGHDPALVATHHDKITREHGPYIANGCMRSLRAIYNHARKTARSLPAENPVTGVDWNQEKRRDTALGVSELRGWVDELAKLDNPVRREFHLFLLLSGSRPDAMKKARVEHIDFRSRILHVPRPKGGEVKAFDIPLSREMIRCLVRVMRIGRALYEHQAKDWVFPADSGQRALGGAQRRP